MNKKTVYLCYYLKTPIAVNMYIYIKMQFMFLPRRFYKLLGDSIIHGGPN